MRESSLVPTNLLNWPRVASRLPEEKLLLLALWSAPFLNCAGVGELPLRPFAASLGLSCEATETGLNNLAEAGLLVSDTETGEIFVADWFRFHKFKTPHQRQILEKVIHRVRSERLKTMIREISATYLPTTTATATITKAFPLPRLWHLTATGIETKAKELGIEQGDDVFPEFKNRVLRAAGITVEEHATVKRREGMRLPR